MTLVSLLKELKNHEIKLSLVGDSISAVTPDGAELSSELTKQINLHQTDLLQILGRSKKQTSIQPILRNRSLPLSFAQEGIWYLEQLSPESTSHNMSVIWRIYGDLDEEKFTQALVQITDRHETLRTAFVTVNDHPVLSIHDDPLVDISTTDLLSLSKTDQAEEAERLIKIEKQAPFDLTQPPLLRVRHYKLAPAERLIQFSIHHIISDAWSLNLLFKELSTIYSNQQSFPPLPIQYADFASWQRETLEKSKSQRLNYWTKQLAGAPQLLELPTDFQRPATLDYAGDTIRARISADQVKRITELSKAENGTPFMVLLAIFKLLLQRHAGQDDIVVGTPIVNRNQVETENLIGFFLNNLALRTNLSGNLTFRELVGRVRTTTLDAYSNQEVPFEKVVQELDPKRDLSYTPLFQLFFNMTPESMDTQFELGDGPTEPYLLADPASESKFDLTLYLRQKESQIDLRLVYKTSLFKRERMEVFIDQYLHLVDCFLKNPDKPINQVSLVTEQSRQVLPNPAEKLGTTWHGPVFEALSRKAAEQPTQIAVCDEQQAWSYGQLEQQSNQLAHYLQQHDIGKGDVVAIYGYRSAPLVWAWMGILKAGAAFVNLDPAYPVDRLRHYLDVSEASGMLCIPAAGPLPAEISAYARRFKVALELSAASQFAQQPATPPTASIGPDDTAYVAFTSGSTGLPKGVRGKHGSLSHFLPWQIETFKLTSKDRFSMLSGLSHDPLQRDIFTALWAGGTLVIPNPAKIGEAGYLSEWMAEQQISFAHMTPPLCQILTESAAAGTVLNDLRYVFFVGDKLTRQDMAQLQAIAPQVTGINSYGATETQRAVGYHLVPPQDESKTGSVGSKAVYPLGQGMPDVQLLVLNQNHQLAGIGESGEIYVRSPHLAGGYLHNADLTAERFLQNSFTNDPEDKVYRTGDLGRYKPDGTIEFAGRADRQFKVRGFRVEPGEIEHVLASHPTIKDAILVAVIGESDATNSLAAYYTTEPARPIDQSELRNFVSGKLPNHMVPATFTFLEQVPLTPNRKIAYDQLPKPERPTVLSAETFATFQSETEETLAAIWCDLLKLEFVGRHANFFELGGHSLLAIRLFNRINDTFGQSLPLTTLFQAPTIGQLADLIEKSGTWFADDSGRADKNLIPIQNGIASTQAPLFCVHGFGGGVVGYGELARLLGTDQPVYGLQANGHDGLDKPDASIEEMAARYIIAMRRVQPTGPYHLSGYCYGGVVAFEMARQLEINGEDVPFVGVFEGYAPLRGGNRESVFKNPKLAAYWLKNLPYWFSDFVGLGRQQMRTRLRRRFKRTMKELLTTLGIELAIQPDDVLDDTDELTQAQLEMTKVHLQALRRYDPGRLNGHVSLFRIRSHALTRVTDPTMGWHKLAEQVDVSLIDGSHNNILEQPHVQSLASSLKENLEQLHISEATPLQIISK